jgi:hypothetical protein
LVNYPNLRHGSRVILIGRDSYLTKVLEQRLFVRIRRIPIELLHLSKLEPRNLVGP